MAEKNYAQLKKTCNMKPKIAKTNENISFVEGDCNLMISMITEVLNMNNESICQILIEELNM